jgi:hypothetical protein
VCLLIGYKVAREFEFTPLRQSYMDPARVQGLECGRDVELGCSHISGLLVGHQMRPRALMDFRALRSLSVLRELDPIGNPEHTKSADDPGPVDD